MWMNGTHGKRVYQLPLSDAMREPAFDTRMPRNNDNGPVEMVDCSIRKVCCEGPKEKLTVWTQVGGKKIQAIVDTGCAQTLIWADVAPQGWAPKVDEV